MQAEIISEKRDDWNIPRLDDQTKSAKNITRKAEIGAIVVPQMLSYGQIRRRLGTIVRYPRNPNEAHPGSDQVINIELLEEVEPPKANEGNYSIKDVIILDSDQLLKDKLAEKEEIIKKLSIELDEFKRVSLFEFDSLDLPDDYYENDTYSDH